MPIKRNKPQPTGIRGIKKDGPGRYLVCTTFLDPKTGKERKREGVAKTLEEAVALKEHLRAERLEERAPTRVKFGVYAEECLVEWNKELAESTQARYANALAHLTVAFGALWIDRIEVRDVRRFQSHWLKKRRPATINGWIRVLKQVLKTAHQDGFVARNVADGVKALREGRTGGRRGRSLDPVQFSEFFATLRLLVEAGDIQPDIERMLIVTGWSGMRRGELLALRFQDVSGGVLHIERAVWKQSTKTTKTDDPRVVAFAGPLASAIEAQRQWLVKAEHPGLASGLVFPASPRHAKTGAKRRGVDEVSWFRSGRVLAKPIDKVVKKAGLPEITLHSFRRTYENLLRMAGVDQRVRRSLAGWRSETAQTIYAGVDNDERAAAVIAMQELVASASPKLRPELRPDPKTKTAGGRGSPTSRNN